MNDVAEQISLFDPDLCAGKMCRVHSAQGSQNTRTSASSSRRSAELKAIPYLFLDLTPGHGDLLGQSSWELRSPWRGGCSMLNTGASPNEDRESFLSAILEVSPPRKYYLSRRACLGILRRSEKRGKPLPESLKLALQMQAGVRRNCPKSWTAHPAAFNAGAGPGAGTIGYSEEVAPTLKAAQSGNMMPAVLCRNDQPALFENYGLDARYRGPLEVAPTVSAAYGTGGNNVPLVAEAESQTLFSRQWVDRFQETDTASTESARQRKDATDLVLQKADTGPAVLLIRRLTPLECERLQGFPDHWTDLPKASDSARYKALGNSVAVPCVEYIMQGIARVLENTRGM